MRLWEKCEILKDDGLLIIYAVRAAMHTRGSSLNFLANNLPQFAQGMDDAII